MDKMKALQCIIYGDFQSVPESFIKINPLFLRQLNEMGWL